jgi:hypothetical protein
VVVIRGAVAFNGCGFGIVMIGVYLVRLAFLFFISALLDSILDIWGVVEYYADDA